MYKLEIKLKQHTPLIHFQHDQEGATLRASEVKPKLDRFIIEKAFDNNFERCKEFLIGYRTISDTKLNEKFDKGYRALNYKLKIYSKKKDEKEYNIIGEKKTGLFFENINVHFFSVKSQLLSSINQNIYSFFVLNNFGFRKSKGFGSFTVENDKPINDEDIFKKNGYAAIYKKTSTQKTIIETITRDYQLLKSGTNFNGYAKSKLLEFFWQDRDHMTWEKSKIKKELKLQYLPIYSMLSYKDENIPIIDESIAIDSHQYIRALLGLAELNEFRMKTEGSFIKDKIQLLIRDAEVDNLLSINRFSSPILFKVINNTIYLLPQEIPTEMLNRLFSFYLKYNNEEPKKLFDIYTPAEFDIIDFLDNKLIEENDNSRFVKISSWKKIY